jgi:hypothetical protein
VYILALIVLSRITWNYNNGDNDHTTILSIPSSGSTRFAYVVAGSAQRWLLDSTIRHVLNPLSKDYNNIEVDYFAAVTVTAGPAFRQSSGYMGHLSYDPLLAPIFSKTANQTISNIQNQLQKVVSTSFQGSTAKLRALRLLENPIEEDPLLDEMRKKLQLSNNELLFAKFPMKDERMKALDRTKAGNKNMIRLFLLLESLWKQDVLAAERQQGRRYDYVMLARDDTLWLDDLSLQRVIQTNPNADAYILSCDARDPPMLTPEINDHGILLKRATAGDILGLYVTTLVKYVDLESCHTSVEAWLGKERGCNSEMILKHVLKESNITVQLVPQAVLPFERAVLVQHDNGKQEYCFHKFCQSKTDPLKLPPGMKKCTDIPF